MAPARTGSSSLPRAGAVSRGYNFASSWEQNAPLTEQQQAAIVALSHAVVERPFPYSLAQESIMEQECNLSMSTKEAASEDSLAVEAVLVNTNQFYKWFTDLESAMKLEVGIVRPKPTSEDQDHFRRWRPFRQVRSSSS